MIARWSFCITAMMAIGCGSGPDASTLTHPPRRDSFPMYVTIRGHTAGGGAIYRIEAPADLNGISEPELLLSGLDFPGAVTVRKDGTLYFVENPSPTTGRISVVSPGATVATLLVEGLSSPQGLAIDPANRLYVAETAGNRISKVSSDGVLTPLLEGVTGPLGMTADENDNLIVAETGGAVVKILPDGTREELATGLTRPIMAGPGLIGTTAVLLGGSGFGDGAVLQIPKEGGTESYLSGLINPKSLAWEEAAVLYVAEGAPADRVIKFSRVTNTVMEVATLAGEPHSIALTPSE